MRPETIEALIEAAARVVRERAAELDELDQAIGDGDHGTNLAKGLSALAEQRQALAALPLGRMLERAGAVLAETVAGPPGRLLGAFLTGMGQAAPAGDPGLEDLAFMLDAGVAALRREGRVAPGEKTMLDVLGPVADAFRVAVDSGRTREIGARVLAAAATGLHRTSKLQALKGKAAALGARSLDHLDPGACSVTLVLGAVVGVLEPHS